MTDEQVEYELDHVPNNPAGRVLWFLDRLAGQTPNATVSTAASAIFGISTDSPDLHLQLSRMAVQAFAVAEEMHRRQGDAPGFDAAFNAYDEVQGAALMWLNPTAFLVEAVLTRVTRAGRNSLQYADQVLGRSSTERRLSSEQRDLYLDDLRGLIDDVLRDDTLSPVDRERIRGLLRQVEDALVHIRLFGADRVEDAAAAVLGVVQSNPDLLERISKKKWARKLGLVIGGLLITFTQAAGQAAIEQVFKTDDRADADTQVVVIFQEDQPNGQKQSTDQPTPR